MSPRRKTKSPGHKRGPTPVEPNATSITQLTKRQREVVYWITRGHFPSEIADKMGCSVKTIDTHRAVALARLGLRNNVELTLLAVRQGHFDAGEATFLRLPSP